MASMSEIWIMILCGFGSLFILTAAVGLLRMPDFFLKVSATTKAVTLGSGLILTASALYFNDPAVTGRAVAIIAFILLTAPVGAHMIGKAAHKKGIKLWDKSVADDLRDEDTKS
jgi:multicomponent Na+:H+ antiporter subunit G